MITALEEGCLDLKVVSSCCCGKSRGFSQWLHSCEGELVLIKGVSTQNKERACN